MRYTVRSDLKIKEIDGEFFVFDRVNSALHSCNRTATLILECLQKSIPISEIPGLLTERFETDIATAETDLVDFLNILEDKKLVEIVQ